jgi:hypothetical protein
MKLRCHCAAFVILAASTAGPAAAEQSQAKPPATQAPASKPQPTAPRALPTDLALKPVMGDFDVMLEIKDKEKSALRAARAARHDPRFIATTSAWNRLP